MFFINLEQTSIERLYWVPYILERWTGPLSLAIQLISDEEWLVFNVYMEYLTKCHSNFERQVALHLVFPANLTSFKTDNEIFSEWSNLKPNWGSNVACPEAKKHLKYLLKTFPTKDEKELAFKDKTT